MDLKFRQIQRKDFKLIKDLALKGWYFAYSHLNQGDLKKLVEEYYSDKSLESSLNKVEKGSDFFVVALEKDIVGFCHVGLNQKGGELHRLYIEPSLIGKGLGKKLLLLGEEFLKEKGCKKYFTFVNKRNKIGVDFYLRNGFKHIDSKDKDDEFEKKVLMYIERDISN